MVSQGNGDGISVGIAQPIHIGLGVSLEKRTVDMDIMPLAGPLQRAVGSKRDGRVVVILRTMCDANPLH